jgi:hypothetical protein
MNKFCALLLALVCTLLLAYTPARAQYSSSSANGTYVFNSLDVSNPVKVLCKGSGACGTVDNVDDSQSSFITQLGTDVGKKKGKSFLCDFDPKNKAAVSLTKLGGIIKGIGKSGAQTGDTTYATGTIKLQDGHIVGGVATFNSFTSNKSATKNSALLNDADTGTTAILCGGVNGGDCANICTSDQVGKGTPLSCTGTGGYTTNPDGTGTSQIWVYPEPPPNICAGGETTWAQCCSDPSLVIVVNLASAGEGPTTGFTRIRSVFTDQGGAGSSVADRQ